MNAALIRLPATGGFTAPTVDEMHLPYFFEVGSFGFGKQMVLVLLSVVLIAGFFMWAIRRNALDCCLSNHFHHFGPAYAASYDLVTQGRAYVDFVRLIDHLKAKSPDAIATVRYEDLVEDPEPNLRDILAHLELEWDESLLEFHKKRRNIRTPSAEQVRQPLNRKGMGTWKPYDAWLGPLRATLGQLAED